MANGILLGGLELFGSYSTNGLRFGFIRGGLQSIPDYRGEDDLVPEASGREPGVFTPDLLPVALHGVVDGEGDPTVFRSRAQALIDKMDPSTLLAIVVHPPHFGLGLGDTATLSSVRPQRIVGPDPSIYGYGTWEITLELVCIDSPPVWVVAEAS